MDETTEKLKATYDAVIYESGSHPRSHPDRLAVAAAIQGINFAPVNGSRVLEIGCAGGGNLIPMAEQLPQSHFLGIDFSARQIELGSNLIRELALPNIELRCQDLLDFPADAGKFDYIIAHGIYSWVPTTVRKRILEICQQHLSERGLAFISYNIYPGWRIKEIAREMMLYHSRKASAPVERIVLARDILRIVAEHTPNKTHFGAMMKSFKDTANTESDYFLLHDLMEIFNEPQYFWQFIENAKSAGLEYVGDTDDQADPLLWLPSTTSNLIAGISADRIEREQYVDFLVNRIFRCSVLCRTEAAGVERPPEIARLRSLYASGNLPESPTGHTEQGFPIVQFGKDQKINVGSPRSIAVLRHLRRIWPAAAPYADLIDEMKSQSPDVAPEMLDRELGSFLEACHRLRMIDLWTRPSSNIACKVPERPRMTPYARWQAAHKNDATSLRHNRIKIEPQFKDFIPLLDGSRDKKAINDAIIQNGIGGGGKVWSKKGREEVAKSVDSMLEWLASSCMLTNDAAGS